MNRPASKGEIKTSGVPVRWTCSTDVGKCGLGSVREKIKKKRGRLLRTDRRRIGFRVLETLMVSSPVLLLLLRLLLDGTIERGVSRRRRRRRRQSRAGGRLPADRLSVSVGLVLIDFPFSQDAARFLGLGVATLLQLVLQLIADVGQGHVPDETL